MSEGFEEITIVEAIEKFRADGFTVDFSVAADGVRCGACGRSIAPGDVAVVDVHRFEGESDPGDEAAVFAVICANCGAKGLLVTTYGPAAGGPEGDVIAALPDRRRG